MLFSVIGIVAIYLRWPQTPESITIEWEDIMNIETTTWSSITIQEMPTSGNTINTGNTL